MAKLKVLISAGDHSAGRGVGVYAQHLIDQFKKEKTVILTDQNPDLIHYPFFDLFFPTLPLKKEKPTIVTIHDVTPLVLSDRYPKGIRGTIKFIRQWYSLRSVSAIITDSENSKKDIEKYLRVSPEKIYVTPLAVDDDYHKKPTTTDLKRVKEKFHLPDKFVLTLAAGPNPNKNIPSLAEVTDRIGIPLVVVGKDWLQEVKQPVEAELIDLVRIQIYNHVAYPGYVSNEDFNAMLHLASVYIQPSLYEGFGLPLLEAMTTGCLVASSRTSSLPEIYYEGAITFNPKNLSSMEKAINKALSLSPAKKQKHIELGKAKSKEFTWKKTAALTLEVYKKIVK